MASETSETAPLSPTELDSTPLETKCYQRLKLYASIASLSGTLVYLAIAALLVGPWMDQALPGWVAGNPWLKLIVLACLYGIGLETLMLPIDFWSSFLLEHRFELSNQSFLAWLWQRVKGYLIGGLIGLPLLCGLYAFFWYAGAWWWVWATLGWLAVTLLLGQLLVVVILPLFYKVTHLDDPALLERLRRLAEGTGLKVQGIYRLHLGAETKKANAALAGLGRTRRVLLGDTLLDQFTPEEIEVVFAHEVGHHVHRHLLKMIVGNVLVAAAGFFAIDLVLGHVSQAVYGRPFHDPAALPLLLLAFTLFGLPLAPLKNAISRFFERQCDRYALTRTHLYKEYRSAFIKLARLNKADPDPHPLVVWFLYDHPPIRERLAMADTVS